MADTMRATVASLLKGIDRYNPENLTTLERYVAIQCEENTYDLEANLAVLKLYQFNPNYYQAPVTVQILLKALTNLPHTDFNLCKSLLDGSRATDEGVSKVIKLADMLETCQFTRFWATLEDEAELVTDIAGFEDSIRKFVCHVVGISFQTIEKKSLSEQLGNVSGKDLNMWISKYGWTDREDSVYIANQEELVKTKKITEKINFDSVADIMAENSA